MRRDFRPPEKHVCELHPRLSVRIIGYHLMRSDDPQHKSM